MSPKAQKPAFDSVIFDIDNVLIDTRRSYVDAVRWTVDLYLTADRVPFFTSASKNKRIELLSPEDVNEFKLLGGFNDDWDCCYGLLIYLTSLPVKQRTMSHLKKVMDIKKLGRTLKKRPLRVNGITEKFGRPQTIRIEKVARIFQEVYLGRELFKITERREPFYWKRKGLINRERLIFRKSLLDKLVKSGVSLGIATGRPRFEALFALRRFGLVDHFHTLTTMNEVKRAEHLHKQSLRKPHPFSLLETAKKMGAKKRFLYIGDLPDDVLAANQAKRGINIQSVIFPWYSSNDKKSMAEIKKAKPDLLLKKPADLPKLILRGE